MKLCIASLTLCLALAVIPASAQQVLYSNGSINGNTDAWTINFGYVVSDSFGVPSGWGGSSTVTGFDFGVWEFPGDTMSSVDWSITSDEFGGTTYGSGTASIYGGTGGTLTDTFISSNQYGYNIDQITVTNLAAGWGLGLPAGTYWLNLQNAAVPNGDPVYWDENSGPSEASGSSVGTIPSEAFDITGTTCQPWDCNGYTPEPRSILLFGSGVLGFAGVLRRKLF